MLFATPKLKEKIGLPQRFCVAKDLREKGAAGVNENG